jgi:hypothetical protein
MAIENEQKKLNRKPSVHTIQNYAMGFLWMVMGVVFLFANQLTNQLNINRRIEPVWAIIFGSACILYGLFRIYRGYTNKF